MTEPEEVARLLGERIAQLREAAGLTQTEFAHEVRVHPVTISKWENGVQAPSGKRLRGIADVLEITVDQLLGDLTELGVPRETSLSRHKPPARRVGDSLHPFADYTVEQKAVLFDNMMMLLGPYLLMGSSADEEPPPLDLPQAADRDVPEWPWRGVVEYLRLMREKDLAEGRKSTGT